jgi:copper chaperone CopZ
MRKVVFTIVDMDCASCAITIDGELEDHTGIKESKTNYAKAQTVVTFEPKEVSEKEIIALIKKSGYIAKPL